MKNHQSIDDIPDGRQGGTYTQNIHPDDLQSQRGRQQARGGLANNLQISALFSVFLWNTSQNGANLVPMGASLSQFATLVLAGCLAGGALSYQAQAGDEVPPEDRPETSVALSAQLKRPALQLSLTDAGAGLRASLWAAHVLRTTSREQLTPADIQTTSGFAVTGPFAERCAGIRLEYAF